MLLDIAVSERKVTAVLPKRGKIMSTQKVILLTGASSGIGYQTAEELAAQGYIVYGATRRVDAMEPLKAKGVKPIRLDVTDEESMEEAVATILKNEGRIDVLVNNAGYGSYGALEDVRHGRSENAV